MGSSRAQYKSFIHSFIPSFIHTPTNKQTKWPKNRLKICHKLGRFLYERTQFRVYYLNIIYWIFRWYSKKYYLLILLQCYYLSSFKICFNHKNYLNIECCWKQKKKASSWWRPVLEVEYMNLWQRLQPLIYYIVPPYKLMNNNYST